MGIWFLLALCASSVVPDNGICVSIFHGIFGRLYIIYWIVAYKGIWIEFLRNALL